MGAAAPTADPLATERRDLPMTTIDLTAFADNSNLSAADLENIAAILTGLGFEVTDSPEFVADVTRLAGAWDRKGLIFRIIGGATYGEAAETADAILEAIAPADLSKAQER